MRSSADGGGAGGNPASTADQVSRRVASTAVAVATTSSPWCSCSSQCWVERFVRTGSARSSNSPSASGPA
jgi:hypothetical protein